MELEVLKIWEESDEIQYLPGRACGFLECKESKGRRKVSETLLDVRHEAGYLEMVYSELLEVRECAKVTQGASAKPVGSKHGTFVLQANTESLDERKKPEVV